MSITGSVWWARGGPNATAHSGARQQKETSELGPVLVLSQICLMRRYI